MAWMGIFGAPGCLRKDLFTVSDQPDQLATKPLLAVAESYLRIRAGTYPPPPIAIIKLGWKSCRILGAEVWHNL